MLHPSSSRRAINTLYIPQFRDINAAKNIRDEALRVQTIYASDGRAGKLILATRH